MSLGCCPDTNDLAADMAQVCFIMVLTQFILSCGDFAFAVCMAEVLV